MTTTIVWIKTQFVGFHRYKDAPDNVAFLRDYHRHVFHVKIGVEVTHDNRDVEFFTLKDQVNKYIAGVWSEWVYRFEASCEMIAKDLLTQFKAFFCTVSEDGENGATVFDPIKNAPPVDVRQEIQNLYSMPGETAEQTFERLANRDTTLPKGYDDDIPVAPIREEFNGPTVSGAGVKEKPEYAHEPHEAEEVRQKFRRQMEEEALHKYSDLSPKSIFSSPKGKPKVNLLEVKTKCFIGTEAEGPHRGKTVLFVPGCVDPAEFETVVRKLYGTGRLVDRVYLGAGNVRATRANTLAKILEVVNADCVDVESKGWHSMTDELKATLIDNRAITFITCSPEDMAHSRETSNPTYVKTVTHDSVIWVGKDGKTFVTPLDDPLFAQDKYVD